LIDELDSYMYQSVGHEIINLFAEAMELPLYRAEIKGDAQTKDKEYDRPVHGDEVEDLYELLLVIRAS
jgi:diphthine-ammonia ligase